MDQKPAAVEKPKSPYLDPENAPLPRSGPLRRWPWLTVLMPFVVYMLMQVMFESRLAPPPEADKAAATAGEETKEEAPKQKDAPKSVAEIEMEHARIPYETYPKLYTWKIILTTIAMLLVIPGYMAFRGGIHPMSIVVGIVGAVLWVGICKLHLEKVLLEPIGLGKLLDFTRRPGFNPLVELASDPTWAKQFLAIRFFGLCVVVPIVEEFFLRGFLMRYVMHIDWPQIPFGVVDRTALIVGTAFPMLMHPGELFAAAVWFSLVTWLMLRYRSIWDCIVAHMITNLLMGLWVLWSGDWWLM